MIQFCILFFFALCLHAIAFLLDMERCMTT
uniref:Uncharacterized protein n=1 Tax=Arundo donax TaxID=35708 RepID=A0A0A9AKE1_ARUDO